MDTSKTPVDYGMIEGCLKAMLNGVTVDRAIVQLIEMKKMNPAPNALSNAPARYRLLLNDGRNTFSFAVLTSQPSSGKPFVEVPDFSIICINRYSVNSNNAKKSIMILDLEIRTSGEKINRKLGDSVPIPDGIVAVDVNQSNGVQSSALAVRPNNNVTTNGGRQQPNSGTSFGQANTVSNGSRNNGTNFAGGHQNVGFEANNQVAVANGNNALNAGYRPQNNSYNNNYNQNGAGPVAKRANLGQNQNNSPSRGNGNIAQTGNYRAQAPSYPGSVQNYGQGDGGQMNRSINAEEELREGETPDVFPLSSLNVYQKKWTVRVRVISKDPIRTYVNMKGEGKLFSMMVGDESGEMKCTGFQTECDKFFEIIEVGKVYYMRNGSLKAADSRYSRGRMHDITLGGDTQIVPCAADIVLPPVTFSFVSIDKLQDHQADEVIDVIGICKSIGSIQRLNSSKTGKEFTKSDIELCDKTQTSIRITLWGGTAEKFEQDAKIDDVIAIKGCKISDFGGRTLSAVSGCLVEVNPDFPEAYALRGWYDSSGGNAIQLKTLSASGGAGTLWKHLLMVQEEKLGNSGKPDYFQLKGTIMKVENMNKAIYRGCGLIVVRQGQAGQNKSVSCNKKLLDNGSGGFHCVSCSTDPLDADIQWRLMLQLEIADFGGCCKFVTAFQEQAEEILGMKAAQLGPLSVNDQTEYEKVINGALFKSFIFKLNVKMETYNDENRMKYGITKSDTLNFVTYAKHLAELIQGLSQLPAL